MTFWLYERYKNQSFSIKSFPTVEKSKEVADKLRDIAKSQGITKHFIVCEGSLIVYEN